MKIQIHKFKTLENLTVQVPAEISGGNGTGKTSILEAISFVLTGKDQDGKAFEQVYDNRVDLHDAIADVSYFDDYGNEFRRTVEPVFTTSRSGEETIKILRSTRCRKNDIDTNDFSDEFEDFYNFGTDFFFNQKEDDQRSMFIDLMKSLLPDYDVKTAQLELKSLKKTQRETQSEIKLLRSEIKGITDKEIPLIPTDLETLENEYQKLIDASSDNQKMVSQINRNNNELLKNYQESKSILRNAISSSEYSLESNKRNLSDLQQQLERVESTSYVGTELTDTADINGKIEVLNEKLSQQIYYDDLNDYAKAHGRSNPIVAENMERMKKLRYATPDNLPEGEELTDVCSACGVSSEATLKRGVENIIDGLKAENKQILTREMNEINNNYLQIKDERDRLQSNLNFIEAENKKRSENEVKLKRSFEINKTNQIDALKKEIAETEKQIKETEKEIADLQAKLDALQEPTLEQLPTELTISDELKEAHSQYQKLRDDVVGAKAVNSNNEEIKQEKTKEVETKRSLLLEVDEKIITLQSEITDYFSNLTNVVEAQFKGKIKIGVELQEYVITRGEYKDVFKITADDKVFPHDCNGAMINNVKLQVLAGLQRLKGYKGITIMDNAEANTTQPIDKNGLNLVVAKATESKELIIK